MAKVLLVQPPFTQLNAPYPAIHYLASFLKGRDIPCAARDLALATAREIFSAQGLSTVFSAAREAWTPSRLAAEEGPNADNLLRYLSNADRYVESIDKITALLSGSAPDAAALFIEPERLPWGHRTEALLEEAEDLPEARLIATRIIEDLADFISYALDPEFSLVRYAESKAASQPSFSVVLEGMRSSWVIQAFVRPLSCAVLEKEAPDLLCLSVPFPGCLAPALAICEEAHARGIQTALGGGYPSTELRFARSGAFFDLVDYLVLDSGYGSLEDIAAILDGRRSSEEPLCRVIRRLKPDGPLSAEGFPPSQAADYPAPAFSFRPLSPERESSEASRERAFLSSVAPDYADADFSLCLRLSDSGNPMHDLWSSGAWLKARLAWGCWWAKCSFCDCELDYIKSFVPAHVPPLYASLREQAASRGLSGVHLVDEAAPIPALLSFAAENLSAGRPLSFWGNSRFESSFSPDRAAFLCQAGLLGVSAGMEVATEAGLGLSNKGLSLADIVSCADALSRSGVLVHAYLMHGLPGQTLEDLVDSLEVLRQMFRLGLLHSAFWHPFVLARHSPLYRDRFRGKIRLPEGDFALNDLDWPGSGNLSPYAEGLEAALASYMAGEFLDEPVRIWWSDAVPEPSVPKDLVKGLRSQGRKAAAAMADDPPAGRRAAWLGGRLVADCGRGGRIAWSWRNGLVELVAKGIDLGRLAAILDRAVPRPSARPGIDPVLNGLPSARGLRSELLEALSNDAEALKALKSGGLLWI